MSLSPCQGKLLAPNPTYSLSDEAIGIIQMYGLSSVRGDS